MWWLMSLVFIIFGEHSSCTAEMVRENDVSGGYRIADYVTKVGCFNDPHSLLNEELINARDPRSPNYRGFAINWHQLKETVNKLVCECAKLARQKGYQYIGLKNFGECWSGSNSQSYAQGGGSHFCMGKYPNPCNVNDDHGCIGFYKVNYIYHVLPERVVPSVGMMEGHSKEEAKGEGYGNQGSKSQRKEKNRKTSNRKSKGNGKKKGHEKEKGKGRYSTESNNS